MFAKMKIDDMFQPEVKMCRRRNAYNFSMYRAVATAIERLAAN